MGPGAVLGAVASISSARRPFALRKSKAAGARAARRAARPGWPRSPTVSRCAVPLSAVRPPCALGCRIRRCAGARTPRPRAHEQRSARCRTRRGRSLTRAAAPRRGPAPRSARCGASTIGSLERRAGISDERTSCCQPAPQTARRASRCGWPAEPRQARGRRVEELASTGSNDRSRWTGAPAARAGPGPARRAAAGGRRGARRAAARQLPACGNGGELGGVQSPTTAARARSLATRGPRCLARPPIPALRLLRQEPRGVLRRLVQARSRRAPPGRRRQQGAGELAAPGLRTGRDTSRSRMSGTPNPGRRRIDPSASIAVTRAPRGSAGLPEDPEAPRARVRRASPCCPRSRRGPACSRSTSHLARDLGGPAGHQALGEPVTFSRSSPSSSRSMERPRRHCPRPPAQPRHGQVREPARRGPGPRASRRPSGSPRARARRASRIAGMPLHRLHGADEPRRRHSGRPQTTFRQVCMP